MGEGHKGKYIYTPFTYIHLYIYVQAHIVTSISPLRSHVGGGRPPSVLKYPGPGEPSSRAAMPLLFITTTLCTKRPIFLSFPLPHPFSSHAPFLFLRLFVCVFRPPSILSLHPSPFVPRLTVMLVIRLSCLLCPCSVRFVAGWVLRTLFYDFTFPLLPFRRPIRVSPPFEAQSIVGRSVVRNPMTDVQKQKCQRASRARLSRVARYCATMKYTKPM